MVEKREINAILEHEFSNFLEKIDKLEDLHNGILRCCICGKIITENNVALIIKENDYKYICDNQECLIKQAGLVL